AGLQVTENGGRGGISSVYLRGAEANFTVVLIDGMRVNDPNNTRGGSFDFSTINLAEVERIEIVRGALSSVYGADALAGVINIITRETSSESKLAIDAELGEDDFYRGSIFLNAAMGRSTQINLTATATDEGDAIEGNSFSSQTMTGRLFSAPGDTVELELSGRYMDSDARAFPEDSGGPQLAVLRNTDRRDQSQLSISGKARWAATGALLLSFDAGYLEHDETYVSAGIAPGVLSGVPPNSSGSDLERTSLGANATLDATDWLQTIIGIDFMDERGRQEGEVELFPGFSLPTDFDLDRDILGLFTELRAAVPAGFLFSASLRHDDPSTHSARTTGRIGVQYQRGDTRLFASWSEGYKLPSFFALGNALVGNPDLRPESSTSWEVGASQSALDGRLDLTIAAFKAEYEDLIDFDFDLFTNINRDKVDTQGFELTATARPAPQIDLTMHVTYVDIDVANSDVTLRQRPEWRGGLSASWDIAPDVTISADWLNVGSTFDSSVPTAGLTLDGYDRVDVEISWRPAEDLRLWLAIDNALDENYQETIGFPALGTRSRLGFRYRF
ncbi:MAG: TonB-dependent receptor, partial [Pseudomonadales bacterium]|nr:TonB-dependent receptor [Pseudomonadales bacterium]